eukprot:TRINITY_DN3683_c0_g1_i4.p1 TRINITY_DN3683_c0_g1~~TRINITY_DN3683_c0_g1_i4.p1  ORF type:complete len:396 (-),score=53.41 TRINITY_DN3683_c0_g1_i4:92-1279(-)
MQNLEILINSYIDYPGILNEFIELNEKMENTLNRYQQMVEQDQTTYQKQLTQSGKIRTAPVLSDSSYTGSIESSESVEEQISEEQEEEIVFECLICFCDYLENDGYRYPDCQHIYCLDCLNHYYTININEGKVLDLMCPNPACETVVEPVHIQAVVSNEIYAKFDSFLAIALINADPTTVWCTNPKGCETAIKANSEVTKHIICEVCNWEFCMECTEEWHEGTCEDYEKWMIKNKKANKKFKKFERKYCKKCPKCKIRIQKVDGCNHMSCGNCGYQFCWLCNGKYTSNHYDAYNVLGCPGLQYYKSDNGDANWGLGKRLGYRAMLGTGVVLALPLAVPAAIIGGPIYGGYRFNKARKRKRRARRNVTYQIQEHKLRNHLEKNGTMISAFPYEDGP